MIRNLETKSPLSVGEDKSPDIIEQYKELNEKVEVVLEKISARKNKKDKK